MVETPTDGVIWHEYEAITLPKMDSIFFIFSPDTCDLDPCPSCLVKASKKVGRGSVRIVIKYIFERMGNKTRSEGGSGMPSTQKAITWFSIFGELF